MRQVPDGPKLPPPKKIVLTALELEQVLLAREMIRAKGGLEKGHL